jgi:hypothetical protein
MSEKPTGGNNYGSIGHMPGSRMGPADHHCHDGMYLIATKKLRNRHDQVIVQEKLDGSNVGIAKVNGEIVAIQRSGYRAETSPYEQHHHFASWVAANASRFEALLNEGERLCGEWLLQAHGTRYSLSHEPFVAFDIMSGMERIVFDDFQHRVCEAGFRTPHVIHRGGPFSVQEAIAALGEFGFHGAIDPVEGAVWRVETNRQIEPGRSATRRWVVDFIIKYVRPEKVDGKWLPEYTNAPPLWNVDPKLILQ